MKRAVTVLGALAVLQLLLLTVGTTPASANTSQGYVGGAGVVTDDWGDEGTLSQSSHSYSGATGLWQWVLYADGAKESDGTAFDKADIDCHFGPNTAAATRNWQSRHGVGVDGMVGPQTFGAADGHLHTVFSDEGTVDMNYVGSVQAPVFLQRVNGLYYFIAPSSGNEQAQVAATYSAPDATDNNCW